MILPYSGCFTRRSTRTTTVLSGLSDTTVPVRTRLGILFLSLGRGLRLGALGLKRLDLGDGAANDAHPARLLELVGRGLEPQVELLALELAELLLQLVVALELQVFDTGHLTCPLRPGSRRDGRRPWS